MVEDDRTDRHRADGGGAVECVHRYPGSVRPDPVGPPSRAGARLAARCGGGGGGTVVRPGRYGDLGGGRMGGGCEAYPRPATASAHRADDTRKPTEDLACRS